MDKAGVLSQDFMGWREMGGGARIKGRKVKTKLDTVGIKSRNIFNANKTKV